MPPPVSLSICQGNMASRGPSPLENVRSCPPKGRCRLSRRPFRIFWQNILWNLVDILAKCVFRFRTCCGFNLLTSKFTWRHSWVHFLDVHPARWLRTRYFSEQHTGKTRLFYFFMHVNLLSAFSLYWIF